MTSILLFPMRNFEEHSDFALVIPSEFSLQILTDWSEFCVHYLSRESVFFFLYLPCMYQVPGHPEIDWLPTVSRFLVLVRMLVVLYFARHRFEPQDFNNFFYCSGFFFFTLKNFRRIISFVSCLIFCYSSILYIHCG